MLDQPVFGFKSHQRKLCFEELMLNKIQVQSGSELHFFTAGFTWRIPVWANPFLSVLLCWCTPKPRGPCTRGCISGRVVVVGRTDGLQAIFGISSCFAAANCQLRRDKAVDGDSTLKT